MKIPVTLKVNGEAYDLMIAPYRTLLDVRPRRVVVLDEGKAIDVPGGLEDAADDFGRKVA